MNSTVEKLETNKIKLQITVDAHIFEEGMSKAYHKNVKKFNIHGFRKGKAPRKFIEQYYGEGVFYEDTINEVCPVAYDQVIVEHGLHPVDHPEMDIVTIGNSQDLVFTAVVTVKPDVLLGTYKDIRVDKIEHKVTDLEVEQELKKAQEKSARWVAVESRPAQMNDRVTIDYSGYVDEEQFPGGTAQNQSLELGSGQFVPGYEEQIVGMNIGEEKAIHVTFPEEYHAPELKGKNAIFKVKLHEIKEKELPVIDDEFARDVSEFDTLEAYQADIREKLNKSAADKSKYETEEKVIQKVVENAIVEIPEIMVEKQIDSTVKDFDYRMRYQGLDLQKYLEHTGISLADFRAQYKAEAYNKVKTQLVIEKVGQVESIIAEASDIANNIAQMAERYKKDVNEFKKTLHEQDLAYIIESIIAQKIVDFLVANNEII